MSGDKPKADFSDVQGGAESTAPIVAPPVRTYTVVKGDTLSAIARHHYGKASHWHEIFEANRDVLKDPDHIYPGQQLKLPELSK